MAASASPATPGLTIKRIHTTAGVHPYDEVDWEGRDVIQTNRRTGETIFDQRGVEFPTFWSENSSTIAVTKYFRGKHGTPEREHSLRQLIDRVVLTYGKAGREHGYFATEDDAVIFEHELTYALLHQMFSFNSPVWFNVGTKAKQAVSACFILAVADSMESILNWYTEEGMIFKGGSGAGVNLSAIRSSKELLSSGGTASGPVSFMRGADASAGAIKSGGACLAPWTLVYTAERGPVAVAELAESGRDFTTLSYNPILGRVQATRARAWLSGHKQLVKLVTDKGEFTMSYDHPVMLMSGGYRPVGELTPGMSVRPACITVREPGYHSVGLQDGGKGKMDVHRLVAKDILGLDIDGIHIHHRDHDRSNNGPDNLEALTPTEHKVHHSDSRIEDGTHPFLAFHGKGNHPQIAGDRNGMSDASGNRTDDYRAKQIAGMHREGVYTIGQDAAARQRMLNKAYQVTNNGGSIDTFDDYFAGRVALVGRMGYSKADQLAKIEARFGSFDAFRDEVRAGNHRVVSVVPLDHSDVYDVEVDNDTPRDKSVHDGHNFMAVSETNSQGGFTGIFLSNTRRAAKMVVLDVDHPDIEEFVETKASEEDKIRALRDVGFDMDLGGEDINSVQFQNANNSVRVTDEFMRAVDAGSGFDLIARTTGEVVKSVDARDLWHRIAKAAWECADPGVQYDGTIQDWHTNPVTGRITASNPCCFVGDTLVMTGDGDYRTIRGITEDVAAGIDVDVMSWDAAERCFTINQVKKGWVAGRTNKLVRLRTSAGAATVSTPEHKHMLVDGTWVEAQDLLPGMQLRAHADEIVTVVSATLSTDGPEVDVYDLEVEDTHTFLVGELGRDPVVVSNSEYMSIDNSSCNLASINLLKFLRDDDTFDAQRFADLCELVITAMDISICFAEFPTKAITKNTRDYRQLGIGYANLGALLMATGHPYDSDSGRQVAASITSLMSAASYRRSAELAGVVGPYAGYKKNTGAHLRVIGKHHAANTDLRVTDEFAAPIHGLAGVEWEAAERLGVRQGFRNAQISLLAPTGTISFLMNCDTTGIEPDFSLVKFKKLVGGGSMQFANLTIPRALRKLGYDDDTVSAIVAHITEHGHVLDAPGLKTEHYAIFDTAIGARSISPMGHVNMMVACQPFLSGAISKTINLPESATVEDIEAVYMAGWKLGLKALAVYRDNCKVGQPLSDGAVKPVAVADPAAPAAAVPATITAPVPVRVRLPRKRVSETTSFTVGGAAGYLTAGTYPDGRIGELFMKFGKQGSTLAGVMDSFSIAISIALQYGVPLETFVEKFTNTRFEPAGLTDDPDIRIAQSPMDYVFRRLALDHMDFETRASYGIYTAAERARHLETGSYEPELVEEEMDGLSDGIGEDMVPAPKPAPAALPAPVRHDALNEGLRKSEDAPLCFTCGVRMVRAGSCFSCESCGATSGCS